MECNTCNIEVGSYILFQTMDLNRTLVNQNIQPGICLRTQPGKPVVMNKFRVNLSSASRPVDGLSFTVQTTEPYRPIANFPHDIWKDRISSFSFDQTELQLFSRQTEALEKKVKAFVLAIFSSNDDLEKVKLVELLCRLGVSYHFEAEIDEQLQGIFHSSLNFLDDKDHDLHTVAVVFRVFRQYGFEISSDVLKRFLNSGNGKFVEFLTEDPRSILSLFEAAHLSMLGEDILDEALTFTTTHLKRLVAQSEPHIANQILSALKIPLHKAMPRMKAQQFISYYKLVDDRNELLLKFAVLDFNRVQLLHRHELQALFKWKKDMDLGSKLPYARDRLVEIYFWSVCEFYEPCYAYARIVYAKILYLLTYFDDTYDAYGTYEELTAFTDAIQRWNIDVLDELPKDYLKHLYKAFLDTFEEMNDVATRERRSYAVSITIDYVKEMSRAYQIERDWTNSSYSPALKESMEKTATCTGGAIVTTAISLIGMTELGNLDAYKWLLKGDYILEAAGRIARFFDDIATFKDEEKRGYTASPFFSYMKQYNVSELEATEEFRRRAAIEWKRINEYWLRHSSTVPKEIILRVVNIARTVEANYRHGDGLTYADLIEDDIKAVLVDPLPV